MLKGLPAPIRVLFDAVVVLVCIAAGDLIARVPYPPEEADSLMVLIFQAVFATIGFTIIAYLKHLHRALHVTWVVLMVWAITGFMVLLGLLPPQFWLIIVLPSLAIAGSIGGLLAMLIERFASD